MTSLNKALTHLGFKSDVDYELQNDADDRGDYIREWYSDDLQPTQEAIDQAKIDWQAEQDATQYKRDRQANYPSIDELIVALWEGVVEERMASVTALEGLRQAVKTKHPKP